MIFGIDLEGDVGHRCVIHVSALFGALDEVDLFEHDEEHLVRLGIDVRIHVRGAARDRSDVFDRERAALVEGKRIAVFVILAFVMCGA